MAASAKQNRSRLTVVFVGCAAALLVLAMGMLLIRGRTLEVELDRMLTESLTAHTVEAGDGAGYLLHYAETALKNTNLLIREDSRPPERGWVIPMVEGFNLVDNRMDLSYLDRAELDTAIWAESAPELTERVLSGEAAVSGLIPAPDLEHSCVAAVHPVKWNEQVVGVLVAKISTDTLLRQGTHSTLFRNVHSVIADGDGRVVFGSSPESAQMDLVTLGVADGITEQEGEKFFSLYREYETASFYYDPPEGRFYVAWAAVGYNGWRIVQFSQSPDVRISQTTMLQTGIMVVSLVLCVLLSALAWRQRNRLLEEQLRYNTLSEFRDTLLFEYNCEDDILEFTSNALDTLELKDVRLENITSSEADFPVFHSDDLESVRRILRSASSMAPNQIEHDRIRMKKRDGTYNWYRTQYKAVPSPDRQSIRLIGTLTDISMQIDREQELRKQAQQDPLTGLYNRAGVKLINARLEQISRGILFMLDLDDFKFVNDTYGHAAGDKLLVAIGRILTETFRTDDIVARVGGDEFVAFLSGSDSRSTAEQKGQELLDRVRALRIEGIDTPASISVGAASAPSHGQTYETLSQAADEALYFVKNSGKGGFHLR